MPTNVATLATEVYSSAVDAPAGGDPRTAASVATPLLQLTNRSLWLWRRVQQMMGYFVPVANQSPTAITGVEPTLNRLTLVGHGLSNNDVVRLIAVPVATSTLPAPLSASAVYYVIVVDADTIQLSATSGPGAAIDITTLGTGTFYVALATDGADALCSDAKGVLPAGTIRGQINYLRDNFAKTGVSNTWSSTQTFSAVALTGGVTLQNAFTLSGTPAAVVWRRATTAGVTETIDGRVADSFFVPVISGDIVISVKATAPTPTTGQRIKIVRIADTAHNIDIKNEGAMTNIAQFVAGVYNAIELEWNGTTWDPVMWTANTV